MVQDMSITNEICQHKQKSQNLNLSKEFKLQSYPLSIYGSKHKNGSLLYIHDELHHEFNFFFLYTCRKFLGSLIQITTLFKVGHFPSIFFFSGTEFKKNTLLQISA